MKKFKNGLLALALIAGVSGAFVTKIHAAPKQHDQVYTWNRNVPGQGTSPFSGDISDAQDHYGCSGDESLCATGTAPGVDDAQIFLNN
jgi:hypothetical protein